MAKRPIWIQIFLLVLAGVLVISAGTVQQKLDARSRQFELTPEGGEVAENSPGKALLTIAPGGLRAPLVNYLWIRADKLKNEGRFYDAMQLADLICSLQPQFPGVWSFHSWNMAWNISVTTHTAEERWQWVYNGVKLLRDHGIRYNTNSIILYKDLAWIFFSKMGQTMDDMHLAYKQRWAHQMQSLLGAPPFGDTQEVLAAFEPIAQAPLNRSLADQGKEPIQVGVLRDQVLKDDPVAQEYVRRLAQLDVKMDRTFLEAWNRFSKDRAAAVVRVLPPTPQTPRERALAQAINDPAPAVAAARNKLLAFVRAQILWNEYKMDPQFMLKLMKEYGPLDWRLVWPHAMYWVGYGFDRIDVKMADIDPLNTERIMLNCLKAMTWNGQMVYKDNPARPQEPELVFYSDWRYIAPTQKEFLHAINSSFQDRGETFQTNVLRPGHINYLSSAIAMLYAGYRRDEARHWLEYIRDSYKPDGPEWKLDVEEYIIFRINEQGDIPEIAINQISGAAQVALVALARNQTQVYQDNMAYARRVYAVYQNKAVARLKLPPFELIYANMAAAVLVRPEAMYLDLPLDDRIQLYESLDDRTKVMIYDTIAPLLQEELADTPLDFAKSFPPPPGLEEFRQSQQHKAGPVVR